MKKLIHQILKSQYFFFIWITESDLLSNHLFAVRKLYLNNLKTYMTYICWQVLPCHVTITSNILQLDNKKLIGDTLYACNPVWILYVLLYHNYQAFNNFYNTFLCQLEFDWFLLQPHCWLQIALKHCVISAYDGFYAYRKRNHLHCNARSPQFFT